MKLMKRPPFLAVLMAACLCVSCSRKPAQTGPPSEVLVTTVAPKDVPVVKEGVATLTGFINADINAHVQGYIVSQNYQDGSAVKKGDLLFQIDPRPFEAALAEAKGTLAKDKAAEMNSNANEKRALDLFNKKVISAQERDSATASAQSNRANVEADEAAVQQAELNLGYTRVVSPIDGIAGIAKTQVGDLVGPSTGPLTTISQVDPIKAVVNVGEQAFTELLTKHPNPDERERYLKGLDFQLILGDGSVFPRKGKFYAEDRELDPRTGTIRVEVTFPNPGNLLRPGQFGKLRVVTRTKKGALVVPQVAVTELQGTYQVAVVGKANKVSNRLVNMGERIGAMWEVTKGLKPGERVIVQGIQKAREGMPVTVKQWTPPAEGAESTPSDPAKER